MDDQGMVSRRSKGRWDALHDAFAVVADCARFSVHKFRSMNNRSQSIRRKNGADALVAEADAENRDLPGERADDTATDPCIGRSARPRRQDDVRVAFPLDLLESPLVILHHLDSGLARADLLEKIEGEGVVVVEEENVHERMIAFRLQRLCLHATIRRIRRGGDRKSVV